MSLQGTLETIPLGDVLSLLAATKKTGELRVGGGRGDGRLWLDGGKVVAADVPRAATPVDAVFELLRVTAGTFSFADNAANPAPGAPLAVDALLGVAQGRLEAWRAIEAVVPSMDCVVSLAPELTEDSVTVSRRQWTELVAVAAGGDLNGVMERLGLGEFDSCRTVKELVDAGLAKVAPAPVVKVPDPAPAPPRASEGSDRPLDAHPAPAAVAGALHVRPPEPPAAQSAPAAPAAPSAPAATPADATPAAATPADATPAPAPAAPPAPAPAAAGAPAPPSARPTRTATPHAASFVPARRPAPSPEQLARAASSLAPAVRQAAPQDAKRPSAGPPSREEAEELVHQLASLSKAPRPPRPPSDKGEAASRGPSAEEPALAARTGDNGSPASAGHAEEEPINRGMLLKFLSSVRP